MLAALSFAPASHAASGGSFVGGAQFIPVQGGAGTSNRLTAPVFIGSLAYSNTLASANNRNWWLGGVANGDLQWWIQNDDGTFVENMLTIHRTNVYFEFIEPVAFTRPVTNTTLTALTIMGLDANKREISAALSGLTFDGTTLTATGGGGSATNAVAVVKTNGVTLASAVTNLNLTNFSVLATASDGTVTIDGGSSYNAANFQPANVNLTNAAAGSVTANSATVTNRFLSGTTNAAPGGTGGTNVVLDLAAANFFVVTATTNLYFTNLANLTTGYTAVIHLLQDGTGGRSVTFDTNTWKLGTNAPTFATNANAWQVLTIASCPHGTNVGVAATTRLR